MRLWPPWRGPSRRQSARGLKLMRQPIKPRASQLILERARLLPQRRHPRRSLAWPTGRARRWVARRSRRWCSPSWARAPHPNGSGTLRKTRNRPGTSQLTLRRVRLLIWSETAARPRRRLTRLSRPPTRPKAALLTPLARASPIPPQKRTSRLLPQRCYSTRHHSLPTKRPRCWAARRPRRWYSVSWPRALRSNGSGTQREAGSGSRARGSAPGTSRPPSFAACPGTHGTRNGSRASRSKVRPSLSASSKTSSAPRLSLTSIPVHLTATARAASPIFRTKSLWHSKRSTTPLIAVSMSCSLR
mmetsp:Transcript_1132/g.3283  ORF Transcript_1132/g.3283 Transcript_1132/m.3283 type:complete len:302 (-) Transcript_1132:265-1170(-)